MSAEYYVTLSQHGKPTHYTHLGKLQGSYLGTYDTYTWQQFCELIDDAMTSPSGETEYRTRVNLFVLFKLLWFIRMVGGIEGCIDFLDDTQFFEAMLDAHGEDWKDHVICTDADSG
jgi:hypothetical protein